MKLHTEFSFDAAHRLVGHKGLCSNLHGHMWHVELEIEGEELDEVGILWDFGKRKDIVKMFDHKTILKFCKENDSIIKAIHGTCGFGSVFMMADNPTAENLVDVILTYLHLDNPKLHYNIKVYESPKSYAEGQL